MEQEQFEQILNRLDTLIRLTVISAFQDKSKLDVIRILSDLGFANKEIASILGTSSNYVAVVRSNLKKHLKNNEEPKKSKKIEDAPNEQ